MKLDRKLWLNADKSKAVEDGSPEAAFLLGSAGTEVSDEEAKRLGISEKQVVPAANKARKPAANK